MTGRPESESVRDHYRRLAPDYNRKANAACLRAYRTLATRCLNGAQRVLELGAGASSLLNTVDASLRVAADLSVEMLRAGGANVSIACDAGALPFPDGAFDAVVGVNLLEHVPEPTRVLTECGRVLAPGDRCLMVTPNGDLEALLDLLERLRLKLPEGPHRFLTFEDLAGMVPSSFVVEEHRRFLAFPAGPRWFVEAVDRIVAGRGLFQYIVLKRR